MSEQVFPVGRFDLGDGFPNIRLVDNDVVLSDGERTVTIPGRWIEKHSPLIHPGDDDDVGRLDLTLWAREITVRNNRDDVRVAATTGGVVRGTRFDEKYAARAT